MRVGQNPAKSIEQSAKPQRITLALITYIPFIQGYYAQSLEVLKLCLESIWQNTLADYDLLVFDNASCPEVRDYLYQAKARGKIQFLILSDRNLGKSGAWNIIFEAAPGEIVAYADSDIYFYPGWLQALTSALDISPQIGMVTGMPVLNPQQYFTQTAAWAEAQPDVNLQQGKLLSWDDFWRHAGSLGESEVNARSFYEQHESMLLIFPERQFYLGAGHFQFVARKSILKQTLPLPSQRPMGQVRALDEKINELGYLRLSTPEWWVQHVGNSLENWESLHNQSASSPRTKQVLPPNKLSFWQWKPVRSVLLRIYNKIFKLLYKT